MFGSFAKKRKKINEIHASRVSEVISLLDENRKLKNDKKVVEEFRQEFEEYYGKDNQ